MSKKHYNNFGLQKYTATIMNFIPLLWFLDVYIQINLNMLIRKLNWDKS